MAAPRRRLYDLGLLAVSSLVGLGVGLLLVAGHVAASAPRLAAGRPNIEMQDFVRDAELGWLPPANLRWRVRERPDAPAFLFLATNRLGLRGAEPEPPAASDILVLGDSYVQGYFLAESETLPAALARRLGARVSNLGVGGYSTDQQYTLLRRVLRDHDTRHVVVVLFINDLVYLDRAAAFGAAKPVYAVRDGRVDFDGLQPVPAALLSTPLLPEPSEVAAGRSLDSCCLVDHRAPFRTRLAARSGALFGLLLSPGALAARLRSDLASTRPSRYARELPASAYASPHALDREWALAFQFLTRIRDVAAARSAGTTVLMLPEPAQVLAAPGSERFFPQQRFLELCAAAGLRCVEPSAAFLAERGRRPLYWQDDNHLAPEGAEFVAGLLAEAPGVGPGVERD